MKKLILLTLVIVCLFTSCKKETESLPTDIAVTKVYIQLQAISGNGTILSSTITSVQ